ncbi:LysR family transcriptional regulator [Bradyrhizobium prioriisuperbiae]|uniref:LysR family transcriptional regulator n=1 Tax=Bradyrhizobium prioriisuperbiae TaxID=2854389 RepID=UPI0028E7C588|nr:LysR family transcriptional regulator [Bradyrhizobium prioritasuperba]
MDLNQLRCFVTTADELHFGRAAHRLDMLPAALGRRIRLLEEDLGTRLLTRTTRSVALTRDGAALLDEARDLIARADALAKRMRTRTRRQAAGLRIGAIDSAAAGLLPRLLHDFRARRSDVSVQLLEDKTIRLLPRLLSGRLDLALVRPPEHPDKRLEILFLFHETAVVAVPERHRLAKRSALTVADLAGQPMIVPERRSRPHSHDLTMTLFAEAGLKANVIQLADEKQTIVNLVAASLGIAIVPRWTSRMATQGVRYVPLRTARRAMNKLPLAAAWVRGSRDPLRDEMIALLQERLTAYARQR